MPRNVDPAGPLPPADADGRLVLAETKATIVKTAISAFGAGCVALYNVLFWYKVLALHIVPPISDIRSRVFGIVSLLAWPALPWLVLKLLLPASLTIDADGILARGKTSLRRLGWEEIREIRLREITMGRGGKTQTQTIVIGPDFRISWMPVYGVAPKALADYLLERRRQARPAVPLEAVTTAPGTLGRLSANAGRAMAMTRAAHLALVLILGGFALVVALLVSFAVHGGPLAAYVLGKLVP
jgi:hypothetical protein